MAEENDAFYVVKKGDIVGVYKNLTDCQAFLGSSASNSSVSVFKGYGLSKETEEYLSSHGLGNAAYSLKVADVWKCLFGDLVACPFQDIIGSTSAAVSSINKHAKYDTYPGSKVAIQSSSPTVLNLPSHFKNKNYDQEKHGMTVSGCASCTLEFDGASKGNPGPAGAGAILRTGDGSAIIHLREGVGVATNNVAEYRAVILGLKQALNYGVRYIDVHGDSVLVCMQIQGLWKIKSQNLVDLCMEAQELKNKFTSFQISHIPREQNSAADAQANRAVNLSDGEIEEDYIACPN